MVELKQPLADILHGPVFYSRDGKVGYTEVLAALVL